MQSMSRADFEFLAAVDRMGSEGKSQEEIAAALRMSRGQMSYRLLNLGYKPEGSLRLRSTALGRSFSDMREAGDIVIASGEQVPA